MKLNPLPLMYRGRWYATAVVVAAAVQVAAWTLDRRPPIVLTGYAVEKPVHTGGPLRITLKVERDLSRDCEATVARYITDGRGFRFYLPTLRFSTEAIRELDQKQPGENRILLQLPEESAPGASAFGNQLSYVCNPVHRFMPISVAYEIPFMAEAKPQEQR